jgi:chromosome partitioning protein
MSRMNKAPTGRVITVGNLKGGTGKTTVTLGLASAIAHTNQEVLVIDLDPQANATSALLPPDAEPQFNSGDVLYSGEADAAWGAVSATSWTNVDLIPANLRLREQDESRGTAVEWRLTEALKSSEGQLDRYAAILIDTPPSVGKLTLNALVASDGLVIVTEPSRSALDGVRSLLSEFEQVQRHMNARITLEGTIVNLMPPRGREAQYRLDELREVLGDGLFEPPLPRREAVREAIGDGVPLHSRTTLRPVTDVLNEYAATLLGQPATQDPNAVQLLNETVTV